MHSAVELNKSPRGSIGEAAAADLHVVEPLSRWGAAARFRRAVVLSEVIADLLTVMSSVACGYFMYGYLSLGKHIHYPPQAILGLASAFAIVMVLMLDRVGAYRRANSLLRVRETEQVLRVSAEGFLIALAVSFFTSPLFSVGCWFCV